MSGHVMRNPAPMKGRHVVGIAPLSGSIRDAQGRIVLDWLYGPRPPLEPASAPEEPILAPIQRGIRAAPTQESLI